MSTILYFPSRKLKFKLVQGIERGLSFNLPGESVLVGLVEGTTVVVGTAVSVGFVVECPEGLITQAFGHAHLCVNLKT